MADFIHIIYAIGQTSETLFAGSPTIKSNGHEISRCINSKFGVQPVLFCCVALYAIMRNGKWSSQSRGFSDANILSLF